MSLHLKGDGHKRRIAFKDSVGDDTTRHICLRTVQDVSPPLSPPLFGPFQGVESGKNMKVSWRRGEDCSRGVLYCSSSSSSGSSITALWWQAGAPLSLSPLFAAMQTAAKVTLVWPH